MVAGFTKKLFGRIRGWMDAQWVSDVPGDIAACEFECKRPECSDEKFIGCERRKRTAELAAKSEETATATKSSGATPEFPAASSQHSPSVHA